MVSKAPVLALDTSDAASSVRSVVVIWDSVSVGAGNGGAVLESTPILVPEFMSSCQVMRPRLHFIGRFLLGQSSGCFVVFAPASGPAVNDIGLRCQKKFGDDQVSWTNKAG